MLEKLNLDIASYAQSLGESDPSVLVGLVGSGISLSRTPTMHMEMATKLKITYLYQKLDIDLMLNDSPSLEDILRSAELCGFAGLNVTYPYKKQVMEYLDVLSETAKAVEAVNTIVFKDGKRIGLNTDLWGFTESFRTGMPGVARDVVLLLGAGGAGVAVANSLIELGVQRLLIFDSNHASAERLSASINHRIGQPYRVEALESLTQLPDEIDGVVNATPVGMVKSPGSAFPSELLSVKMWVADIVYFPLETELLKAARSLGCQVLSGAGMAIFQAKQAFELFSGAEADVACMEATFRSFDE